MQRRRCQMQSIILIVLSLVVVVSFIGLIRPIPKIGLNTRKRALVIMLGSFFLGALLPERSINDDVISASHQGDQIDTDEMRRRVAEILAETTNEHPFQDWIDNAIALEQLSDQQVTFIELYDELQEFRYDEEFHRFGFGACCRFAEWKERVENLQAEQGSLGEHFLIFLPYDLITLGMDYMRNEGHSVTEFSQEIEEEIETVLVAWRNLLND